MPKLQSYSDMTVEIMQSTPEPSVLVGLAKSITMQSQADADIAPLTLKQAKFLIEAEHTSLFEHVIYTFLIQGVSRSFLAQITRQRTASPTSGSQHYQDYSDYPCTVANKYDTHIQVAVDNAYIAYKQLLGKKVLKEEARQVLPNAACVNYLWTIDARNLFQFLRMRLCNRNVLEMRIFAFKVLELVRVHFYEYFIHCGPQCTEGQGCKQGFLQCEGRYVMRPTIIAPEE